MSGGGLQWEIPQTPTPPPGRGTHALIAPAFLTASRTGPLHLEDQRRHQWHVGAVYTNDGLLVRESRRHGGLRGDLLRSLDQESLEADMADEELAGTWYYGGQWFEMFGHFLVETLPHLWLHDGSMPVIWHVHGDPPVRKFQRELLSLAGIDSEPRFTMATTRVGSLMVPARPVGLNAWVSPEARDLWQRVAARVDAAPPHRMTWLSRTAYEGRADVDRDRGESFLDDVFQSLGFEVRIPEELAVTEQIRLVRESRVIAGTEGSALHLSAFARPGTNVMMLGSSRGWRGNHTQPLIDGVTGNRLAIVPFLREKRQPDAVRRMVAGLLADVRD